MVGTADLRSLARQKPDPCNPLETTLLSRDLLTRPNDPQRDHLHRGKGSPAVRVAAGRWQVVAFDSRYPVIVTWRDDLDRNTLLAIKEASRSGKRLSPDVLTAIAARQFDQAVPGHEVDVHDGTWVLLVRQWPAMLTIRDQPPLDDQDMAEQAGAILTDEGVRNHQATQPGHRDAVMGYLGLLPGGPDAERGRVRRLAVAYRYRGEVLQGFVGQEDTDEMVSDLFQIDFANVKELLRKKIWVRSTGQRDASLVEYLLAHRFIIEDDVREANRYIAEQQRH